MSRWRNTLIVTLIVLVLLVIGGFVAKHFMTGRVVIDLSGVDTTGNFQLFVNDKAYNLYGFNEADNTLTIFDAFGRQDIVIHSAKYRTYNHTEYVWSKDAQPVIKPSLEALDAREAADSSLKAAGKNNYEIISASYKESEEEGGLALFLNLKNDGVESMTSMHYDKNTNYWVVEHE